MIFQIGDQAPDFSLPDQEGRSITLSSFCGSRVIIYFYPKDNTPGCTKEACNFRDNWSIFKTNNIQILGISKDSAKSHSNFIDKYDLPFTLLTDEEPCKVASMYESYGLKKFMGREYMGILRNAFVISKDGKFEQIYLKVKPDRIVKEIITDLLLS